jgi:hypothetical protein
MEVMDMPIAISTESFYDFLIRKLGGHWVIARRTARIIEKYGEEVICVSHKRYLELDAEWSRATFQGYPRA